MALRTAAVFLVVTFGVCRPAASFQDDRITALKRAAALIEEKDLGPAETALQRVLAESPEDAVALNLLGLIRARQEKSAEAERLFRRAIATGQGIVGPHLNLARLYASDRPLDALRELRTVLSRAPSDEQASTLLRSIAKNGAGDALRSNRKDDALVLVRLAREIQPKDPEVLYLYGMVAFQEQLYSDAQLALEQALQLRPHFSEARYALSRVYLNENRAQAAEQEMRRYLETKPNDASAQYGLGYILMAEQKLEEAKGAFERSLALQSQQTESLYQLGEIALEQGRTDNAQQIFEKVLSRDPHYGGALTGLGMIAFQKSNYEGAKAYLEQAVAAAPDYQKAHYYYALTLLKTGERERASKEFEISKQLQKKHTNSASLDLPQR